MARFMYEAEPFDNLFLLTLDHAHEPNRCAQILQTVTLLQTSQSSPYQSTLPCIGAVFKYVYCS